MASRTVRYTAGLITLVAAMLCIWAAKRAQPRHHLDTGLHAFRVRGSSMVPTLLGDHHIAHCAKCDLQWPIDPVVDPSTPTESICFHCGRDVRRDNSMRLVRGEIVEVVPLTNRPLARGDVVAVRWDGQVHIKRIVALPGDTVDLDGIHLTVNNQPMESLVTDRVFEIPRFLVDDDGRRTESRWSPAADESAWTRIAVGRWKFDGASQDDWLIYRHRSVHDQGRPSPIWDDYSFNVGLQRRLVEASRLEVHGTVLHLDSASQIHVAMWCKGVGLLATAQLNTEQRFTVSSDNATPQPDLPVTAEQPIAIRCLGANAQLDRLIIRRLIEYRLLPTDRRDRYPLTVTDGNCFLLGDNVPVSVDSRAIGLVPIANIQGLVYMDPNPRESPGSRRASSEIPKVDQQ